MVCHRLPELVPAEAEQDRHVQDFRLLPAVRLRFAIQLLHVHVKRGSESVAVDLRLAVDRELVVAGPYELTLVERLVALPRGVPVKLLRLVARLRIHKRADHHWPTILAAVVLIDEAGAVQGLTAALIILC